MSTLFCVFCEIARGKAPVGVVYADDRVMAFMDIQPMNLGQLLVVPRDHASQLSSLDGEIGGHFQVALRVAGALKSGLRCEGVSFFLADGKTTVQEFFHVHVHVTPRFDGDGFGLCLGPHCHRRPSALLLTNHPRVSGSSL